MLEGNPASVTGGAAETERDGFEAALDYAWGHFDDLGTGVGSDYQMWQTTIAARLRSRISEEFEYAILGGIAWHVVQLDFDGPIGTSSNRNDDSPGVFMGLEANWAVAPPLSVYGRSTIVLLPYGPATSGQLEAGLRLALARGLHAFGGYRHWRFRLEGSGSGTSNADIDLTTKGIVFGLELRF